MLLLRKIAFVFALLFSAVAGFSQADPVGVADRILAMVGRNRIILDSELEAQFSSYKQQDPLHVHDSMKCQLLQQMIFQKLMVEQAEHDSLLVSEEDVEGNIANRIRYYTRQFGSQEKLEEVAGKTIYQLKEEFRDVVREQMLAEKMQSKILENEKITPAEVRVFFDKIPVDSLPFYPATIEVGQIVIDPQVSAEMDDYAKKKAQGFRDEIVNGTKTFEYLATSESEDPGSRDNGGLIENVTRNGGFVQEFVAAAFKLQNGEISPVVKTQFGYHIIQMVRRKGEQVDVRHILVTPQRVSSDYKTAMSRLDSIRALLITGKYSFSEAVGKFSTDEAAKQTGGMIIDPQTGTSEMEIDKMDPGIVLMIDTLKPGSYSQPHTYTTERGQQSARIVYLKTRTEPHKANLKDDYAKIQQIALAQKQAKKLEEWMNVKLPGYYLKLDPAYQNCPEFRKWNYEKLEK